MCSLVDPFRPVCEWQRGLCKEPQRGRSGQSDRRSGQQSVTLNTSPWHCADTLCHRPTHCLSALFTHTRTHKRMHARRDRGVCVLLSVNTLDTDHLCVCVCVRVCVCVCQWEQQRETKISREEGSLSTWEVAQESQKVSLLLSANQTTFKKWLILTFFLIYGTLIENLAKETIGEPPSSFRKHTQVLTFGRKIKSGAHLPAAPSTFY